MIIIQLIIKELFLKLLEK